VFGQSDSPSGFGVVSAGNSFTTGTKSFRIDHPLDPENKYLQHYCVEGPAALNVYRGNVRLDERGEAWVELPAYYERINRDETYQLTAVGGPGPGLYVAERVKGNRFRIAGGSAGLEVSWSVVGVRNDLWVRSQGMRDEVDKPLEMRGKYVHPWLYGQGPERGEFFRRPRNTPEASAIRSGEEAGAR
jgi:hypothetical protein